MDKMKNHLNQDLKDELWEIQKIFLMADESYKIVKRLAKIKRSYFFQFIMVVSWRVATLEMMKLFSNSRNDKYNLNGFIDKLKTLGLPISSEMFVEWEQKILLEKDAIDNLKTLRDKVYAHTDIGSGDIANTTSLGKTEHLLSIAFEIIRDIRSEVFEESLLRDVHSDNPTDDLEKILDILKQNNQKWDELEKSLGIN